jgi:EmrB/QacA subfamily drug resistance transporter
VTVGDRTALEAPAPVSRHLGLALVVICTAQLMLVLDDLIVNTALPHIQAAMNFSGTGLEWVVTAYALTFGGLLMLGGRAGDILGRRRMFAVGIAVFSFASLLGGFAPYSWWLLASRALQGVGAAITAPAALSLIAVTFPEGKPRNQALGVYAAMTGMGGAVGLIAGGLLTTYGSWRWVFFFNVPIGLLLAVASRYVIPETKRHPLPLDLPGAVTGTAGFGLLVYGLTRAASGPDGISHWGDAATILSLIGAAIAIVAFVAIEARTKQPLLPLRIFANRNRTGVYLVLLCLSTAFFAMFFFLTLFMQLVWGYSPLKAGLAYLPFTISFLIVAGICSKIASRVGARILMTCGASLCAVAMFWLSRIQEQSDYATGILLPQALFAAGAGLVFVPLTMTLVAGISEQDSGIASSMFNAGQQIGGAVGLATIGSAAWTVVNNDIRQALSQAGGALAAEVPGPGNPIYSHGLVDGVGTGLSIGAGCAVAALIVTIIAIRVRREDLPDHLVVV